jgi:hypothetical protein
MQRFSFIEMAVGIMKVCSFNERRRKKCHPERHLRRTTFVAVQV